MLRLLKNAESNADAKNLELEDLYIRNINVQQAPVSGFLSRWSSSIFAILPMTFTHLLCFCLSCR
jgi:hypothetical protein